MKRMAQIIRLRPEKMAEYNELHAAVWPDVLACIARCNIRNYSIFLREPENLLFAYFEYHGTDYAADMEKMKQDEATQRWWVLTDPCQEPLETRKPGEWWAPAREVFHTD